MAAIAGRFIRTTRATTSTTRYEESGFAARYPDHPGANKQPFFFTTPRQRNNQVVLRYQQRFVDKLLDHSLQYDHVLYCMDNETNGEEAVGALLGEFVKERAAKQGQQVYVTEMWDDWNLTRRAAQADVRSSRTVRLRRRLAEQPQQRADQHWDNFLHVRKYLAGSRGR